MATRFERAMKELIDVEGTMFSDDPEDNGGATRYGITLATLRNFRGDDTLTAEHVEALTLEESTAIYRGLYWRPWMDESDVPEYLAVWVFVNGVNEGVGTAVQQAQRVCGIKSDGKVGPLTIAAFSTIDPETFLVEASMVREARDRTLADYPKYRDGWLRRAFDTGVHCARLIPNAA